MSEVFDCIPDKWSVYELGSLGTTYSGLSGKNKDDFGRGKKYIPYMNIYTNPSIDPDWMELVDIGPNEKQNLAKYGDIFFTTSSETPDEVGISSVLLTEVGECYLNSFCFGFRPNNFDAIIPEYAQHFFRSELFRQQMYELAQGATRYNLSKKSTLGTMVLLPPLPEQRKIAEILGTWDEAIRLTAELIAAKQQRKKGLMQRLLSGEVRFPGFEGRPWREVELAGITEIIISNVDKKLSPAEKPVRLCNYTDVFKNAYIHNSMTFMEGSATPAEINRFGLRKHDVIITKDSETAEEIAEAAVVIEDLNNVVCGYHLAILRPDPQQAFGPFLNEMLHHAEVRKQFVRNANGITRYGLTQATIREATLSLPNIDEQMKISMVLQACDHEIDLLQQKLVALQQQKKGLMQRLLTGEVRVKV